MKKVFISSAEYFKCLNSQCKIDDLNFELRKIKMPFSVEFDFPTKKIPKRFFANTNLAKIIIPDGVTEICEGAFENCKYLKKVTIPNSINYIGYNAFSNTPFFKNEQKKNPLVILNNIVVDGSKCTGDIVLPDNIEYISPCAFEDSCINSITLPKNLKSESAFCRNAALDHVITPLSLREIISKYDIYESISYDTGLRIETSNPQTLIITKSDFDINNPKSVIKFNEKLRLVKTPFSVKFDYPITKIPKELFNYTYLEKIEIPSTVDIIDVGAFSHTPFLSKKQEENPLVILNNIVVDGSKCTGDIVLPDNIEYISPYAFLLSKITSITLPNKIKKINDYTFSSCHNLKTIVFPKELEQIGDKAFQYCDKLKKVKMPKSVKSIGALAFDGTQFIQSLYCKSPFIILNGILADAHRCEGNVIIPDTVKSISPLAFWESDITSVTIPQGIIYIGKAIFCCCENLSKIIINSQKENFLKTNWGRDFFNDYHELIEFVGPSLDELISSYNSLENLIGNFDELEK